MSRFGVGAFIAILLGGAAWLWYRRRGLRFLDAEDTRIDVVASRTIGTRQRLMVIDIAGERLTLSVNDKRVELLARRETDARPRQPSSAVEARAAALRGRLSSIGRAGVGDEPLRDGSAALAGLLKLRGERKRTASDGESEADQSRRAA